MSQAGQLVDQIFGTIGKFWKFLLELVPIEKVQRENKSRQEVHCSRRNHTTTTSHRPKSDYRRVQKELIRKRSDITRLAVLASVDGKL